MQGKVGASQGMEGGVHGRGGGRRSYQEKRARELRQAGADKLVGPVLVRPVDDDVLEVLGFLHGLLARLVRRAEVGAWVDGRVSETGPAT